MNELQFESELIQYLCSGTITPSESSGWGVVREKSVGYGGNPIDYVVKTKLWKYEPDIKTTDQLWDNFKRIKGLKILNLCRNRQDTLTSLDVFRDVCGQYPGCALSDYGRLPEPEKVHIAQYIYVQTRKTAKRAAEHFAEYGVVPM